MSSWQKREISLSNNKRAAASTNHLQAAHSNFSVKIFSEIFGSGMPLPLNYLCWLRRKSEYLFSRVIPGSIGPCSIFDDGELRQVYATEDAPTTGCQLAHNWTAPPSLVLFCPVSNIHSLLAL